MISQFKTEGVLRDHVAKHGVHVETSTEPTAIEQDADGVNVTLKKVDDAGKETIETVRASYVIGADGGRSESSLIISAATCGSTSTHRMHTGVVRGFIGATFQGQTKDADGQVWAECEIEGLSDDVSASCLRRAMQ